MVFDKLGESLTKIVKKITFASLMDEKFVKEVIKDIQRALLSADVNVKLVMEISKKIENRALNEKPKPGLSKKQHILSIVYAELVEMLGEKRDFSLPKKANIMLVGIQGSGKTTSGVKLAKLYAKKGLKPFLIAADIYRPAAYEQLAQLADASNIKFYGNPESKDTIGVVKGGMEKAKKFDITILDTAGRHKSEDELFQEMKMISKTFRPEETFLVIDSNIGQAAGAQAKAFNDAIGLSGVILTKLDGSAKGGGALSAVAETSSTIRFISTGESVDAFEVFDPDRFISRLLGMGDLASLIETAKETIDEKQAMDILKGDFTLNDLYSQIEMISRMGPLSNVMKMIPGFSMAVPKDMSQMTEKKMKKYSVIMDSMTDEEKNDPKILNSPRHHRIARGSGSGYEEVKELMNYYKTMKKALKGFKKGRFNKTGLAKMMRQMR
ncbi:MAG: signal recognition particle protein Srp54 [Candidatus Hydrothermarchaeales archaeon]